MFGLRAQVQGAAPVTWLDVEVVESDEAANPRHAMRRHDADWYRRLFDQMQRQDRTRVAKLEARVRGLDAGRPYRVPTWPCGPPVVAFDLSLNGKRLGRVAAADPGLVSIDVVVMQRPDRQMAALRVDGADRVGQQSWRDSKWPWELQRLKVGDRVRITVVRPVRLTLPSGRQETTEELSDRGALIAELSRLKARLRSRFYSTQTARMIRSASKRPPPRAYPRGTYVIAPAP
jgi:hypothetical protein